MAIHKTVVVNYHKKNIYSIIYALYYVSIKIVNQKLKLPFSSRYLSVQNTTPCHIMIETWSFFHSVSNLVNLTDVDKQG